MMQVFVLCYRLGFWLGKKHRNAEFFEKTTASYVYSELNYCGIMVYLESNIYFSFIFLLINLFLQTEKLSGGTPLVMAEMPLALQSHLLPKTSSRPQTATPRGVSRHYQI